MRYEKVNCPVCNKEFKDGDDIVVCPECGTPHHRECYKSLGHCAMEAKHAENYSFKNPHVSDEGRIRVPNIIDEEKSKKEAPMGAAVEIKNDNNGKPDIEVRPIEPDDKVDDEFTAKNYGDFIGKNKNKYIPKFMNMNTSGKKASWNWAAFFFPIPWLFYRKMYKVGIIVALISVIIPIIFAGDFYDYFEKYSEAILAASSSTQTISASDLQNMLPTETIAYRINSYVSFFVDIIVAVFGNYFYKGYCRRKLSDLKKKNENPIDFETAVAKKGGTSVLGMILALLLIYAVTAAMMYIYGRTGFDIAYIFRK